MATYTDFIGTQKPLPRVPYLRRLRMAAEDASILFVKWTLVLGLWAGAGFLLWERAAVLRSQAWNGQLAYQWLSSNEKELTALVAARKQIDEALKKVPAPK